MRDVRRLVPAAALAILVGVSSPAAIGAMPAPGSRYLSEQRPLNVYPGEPATAGALQVSPGGRSLRSSGFPIPAGDAENFGVAEGGSYIQIPVRCRGMDGAQNVQFALGAPAHHRVAIRHDGSFAVRAREVERGWFTASGTVV